MNQCHIFLILSFFLNIIFVCDGRADLKSEQEQDEADVSFLLHSPPEELGIRIVKLLQTPRMRSHLRSHGVGPESFHKTVSLLAQNQSFANFGFLQSLEILRNTLDSFYQQSENPDVSRYLKWKYNHEVDYALVVEGVIQKNRGQLHFTSKDYRTAKLWIVGNRQSYQLKFARFTPETARALLASNQLSELSELRKFLSETQIFNHDFWDDLAQVNHRRKNGRGLIDREIAEGMAPLVTIQSQLSCGQLF